MQTEEIIYKIKSATLSDVEQHLNVCSDSFIPPLNSTVNICEYSKKIQQNAVTLEAWNGAILIGLVAIYCNNMDSKSAFITNVSVMKQYTGKGISSQLLKSCIDYVRKQSFKDIILEVNAANVPAIALYKKFNFNETESKNKNLTFKLIL